MDTDPEKREGSERAGAVGGTPAEKALLSATAGLDRDQLLRWLGDAAKLWLAHDGLWFRTVEEARGLEEAVRLDERAMGAWSAGEARRVAARLGLPSAGGLDALDRALRARLYALLNEQEIRREHAQGREQLVFTMRTCRVQDARDRQGLAPFPCRQVGLAEYREFARVIDPRLKVTCRFCPPDERPADAWCSWMFTVEETVRQPDAEEGETVRQPDAARRSL